MAQKRSGEGVAVEFPLMCSKESCLVSLVRMEQAKLLCFVFLPRCYCPMAVMHQLMDLMW